MNGLGKMNVKRGEIFIVNLEPIKGREHGGIRPCLIIQNNISNVYSPVTIIAAITSKFLIKNILQMFLSQKKIRDWTKILQFY